jgi:hypothetical protein
MFEPVKKLFKHFDTNEIMIINIKPTVRFIILFEIYESLDR